MITLTLSMDMVLTNAVLKKIKRNGFSRIPIIDENNPNRVIGVLLSKSCLGVDVDSGKTISQLYMMREIEIKIPLYTWCIIDSKVIHSVDNIVEGRIGIQISLMENLWNE